MNLLASIGRRLSRGNGFAAAFILATLFAPPAVRAADAVLVGSNVTFIATADGSPAPTFQWRKNGTAIPGATGSSLSLTAVTLSDSATYQVVATNEAGSAISPDEVLVVDTALTSTPPAIVTQPAASQTAVVGGTVSFTVSATGAPAPTFQWQKNGAAIAGATNATLQLTALTTADTATYMVVASNSAGSVTSNPALLTVVESTSTGTAPVITTQPVASQTVSAGANVNFTVVATGNPAPTYQWRKNGSNITGATNATLTLSGVTSVDAATYNVVASNSAGAAVSNNAVLLVYSSPTFAAQPTDQVVTLGASAKFAVTVNAIPGATLQWHKDGLPISGATSSMLLLSSTSTSDVGKYSVLAKNDLGSTMSQEAALVIGAYPVITTQPISQTVSSKSNVTLTVAASGSPSPAYQWKRNGALISGATSDTLFLKGVNRADAGDYTVEARNALGWALSQRATLVVNNVTGKSSADDEIISGGAGGEVIAQSGLVNLSVRSNAGTGADGLIVGFVIDGSSSKSMLIRGVGPSLREFGVSDALSDPQLALYSGAIMAASNDDWSASENAVQIAGTSVRVGAFSLAPQTSDSALMATLQNGAYTVQLSGKESTSGVALVEVYDAASSSLGKLVNLSVRTHVGTGADVPNVGFVVAGASARTVMIRAVGPALGAFGVTGVIADPQIELFRGSTRVDQNDNWGGSPSLNAVFAQVGAFGFSDQSSRDAVLVATLLPGAYTVVVSGVNGTKGVGLVEVYDLP